MKDPVVAAFLAAAEPMVDKFVTELEKDPAMCAAVMLAAQQGERRHIGITTGGGTIVIALEMVNDYGNRRTVASITATAPPIELDQVH